MNKKYTVQLYFFSSLSQLIKFGPVQIKFVPIFFLYHLTFKTLHFIPFLNTLKLLKQFFNFYKILQTKRNNE